MATPSPPAPYQLFLRDISGRTLLLRFPSPRLAGAALLDAVASATSLPLHQTLLLSGSSVVTRSSVLFAEGSLFPSCRLSARLRGGKGGFGSLLRGAASKAGQKKTNNFDACRDISGRRLRHVNAEKRIEEWRAEAEDRKLEKIAEDFLKKKAREGKKGGGEKELSKYVNKFKEDAEKCAEVIEQSVRQSLKKRKEALGIGSASKRLKILLGKKKVEESDDDDDDREETEVGNDTVDCNTSNDGSDSVIIDDENGSSGSDSNEKVSVCAPSSTETSTTLESLGSVLVGENCHLVEDPSSGGENSNLGPDWALYANAGLAEKISSGSNNGLRHPEMTEDSPETVANVIPSAYMADNENGSTKIVSLDSSACHAESKGLPNTEELLDLASFHSAADLQVLGLDRLKAELQARGLKCGGTLQERASRLFLLKTTPFDKLPKKLLAKPASGGM